MSIQNTQVTFFDSNLIFSPQNISTINKSDLSATNNNCSLDVHTQAKTENATNQLKLGIVYFNAYHIEENCSTAFKWFKLSAEQGNMEAQFRLAELYSLGLGVSKSHTNAYKWYTKAAIQGYKKASIRIRNLYQEDIRMQCRGKLDSQEKLREKPRKDKYIGYDIYNEYDIYKKETKYYVKKLNYFLNEPNKDNENDKNEKTEYYYRELYEQRLDDHKSELNHAIEYYTAQFKIYKSSNQEDPEIQKNLGFLYQHGYGAKKYEKWAIEYYIKAAEQGCIDSQYQLGALYQNNTDVKFNYKKAYHWYCLAATGGNTVAQNHLAYFYEKGLGTTIDHKQALHWYTRAAESGHSMAQLTLGKWYRKGCYVNLDYSMTAKWYTLAARQGNSVAQNCLVQLYQKEKVYGTPYESDILCYSKEGSKEGRLCSKLQADILKINDPQLVENIKKLAKRALRGDGNAMYEVGLKYYNGTDFNENKLIGFRWIKNAADAGHKEALFKVTSMYKEGDTVQQDFHKIAIWTKKLAKQKNDIAQCNLGILYKEGHGVRRDPLEASKWFTLSAEQGNCEAQYQLGCLRQTGKGLRKYEEEALELFNCLAIKGDINGCYALGIEYFDENRSKIDEMTALRLLEYSAKHGNENAQFEMWMHCSEFGDKLNADFYFDMLLCSQNAYIINKTLIYSMSNEDFIIDYIKYFNYLKQAAVLGNPLAQDVFRTPPMSIIEEFTKTILSIFILISEEGILSMEYNLGYLLELIFDFDDDDDDDERCSTVLQLYSNSAKKGDSRAQVRSGVIYEEGKGVDLNIREAINYYNLAYEEGNQDAMYRLACMYLDGRGVSQNLEKAFELFTQASDVGHIEARKVLMLQHYILDEYSPEYIYYSRLTVKINNVNQIKMLEKMAESGLVAIQYQLGIFYENRDNLKAFHWFTLAAHGGVTDAHYRLGVLYEEGMGTKKDYSQSISYYEKAVINEHEDAMYRLAEIYLYGKGVKVNYCKAYQLYSRAATMGHTLSCKILADNNHDVYYNNEEKARISFDPSSNQFNFVLLMFKYVAKEGDVKLQYKLGVIYECILDTPNYEKAAEWYSMAANNSHREAMYRLGLLYEAGIGVTRDYKKAMQLYTQAYKLGNYDAFYRLGSVYHHGTAADIDYKKAVRFYKEAADNGHLESQYTLGKLYEQGSLIQKNPLKALKWYTRDYLKGYDPARTDLYAMYDDPPFDKYFVDKLNNFLITISKKILLSGVEKYGGSYGFIFYRLGIQYLYGNGIPQDYKESLKCFKIASEKFKSNTAQDVINMKYSGDKDLFLKVIDMYETHFANLESSQQYSLAMVYYNGVVNTKESNIEDPGPVSNKTTGTTFDRGNDNQNIILATDYKKTISLLKKIQGGYCNEVHVQLAKMYTYGHGVEKSIEKVIEHYIKAWNDQPNYYAFEIAQIYHFDSFFCNFSKAIEWYEKADIRNKGAALNILGLIYKSGDGVNQDYDKSLQYFMDSAAESYRESRKYPLYNLGLMYYHGNGTEQNYAEAYKYFKKAANENHITAQTYLANMYLNGYGVEKNIKKAKKMHKKSLHNTYNNKNIGIADISEFIYVSEAFDWLKKMESGNPLIFLNEIDFSDIGEDSMELSKNHADYNVMSCFLGKMYYKGDGVQIDYHQAFTYFLKEAEAGHSEAQIMLAKMYTHGHGVDKDIEKVIEWYTKATKDNLGQYSFKIARLYEEDDDFQDNTKAIEWYKKVEGDKKFDALLNIGSIYISMQERQQALQYYRESASFENESKLYSLGMDFYNGLGVNQDYNIAYVFFKEAAYKNHISAQLKLAEMYTHGNGVDKNIEKVIEWYTKASENKPNLYAFEIASLYKEDDCFRDYIKAIEWYEKVEGVEKTYALNTIGYLYCQGEGVAQDYNQALSCFKESASLGDEYALYNLGLMYWNGQVVAQDFKEAYFLFKAAADNSHIGAQLKLVEMYTYGYGVDKDIEKVIEWYTKASEDEPNRYAFEIASLYYDSVDFQDITRAIEWYKKVEGANKSTALNIIGTFYHYGTGVDQDYERALQYYKEAANFGNEYALYNLGLMYYYGQGVDQDYKEAYVFLEEAACKNHSGAQLKLAGMYIHGHGVEKDIEKVIKWYTIDSKHETNRYAFEIASLYEEDDCFCDYMKAIEWYKKVEGVGKGNALNIIGYFYYHGEGVAQDYEQAFRYFKESASLGNGCALYHLGLMYYNGQGTYQDIEKAIEYYIKAEENGFDYAEIILGELYHHDDKIQDFSKAFDWYQKTPEDKDKNYALRGIGLLFEYGDGVTQDYEKSVEYYQQSADLRNKGGFYNLALMYYYGKGVEQDYKKCFDLLNESIKDNLRSGCTYVFVRTQGDLSANPASMNRVYSLEDETILYGEIYFQLGIMHKQGQGTPQDDSRANVYFLQAVEYGIEPAKHQIK